MQCGMQQRPAIAIRSTQIRSVVDKKMGNQLPLSCLFDNFLFVIICHRSLAALDQQLDNLKDCRWQMLDATGSKAHHAGCLNQCRLVATAV